MFYRVTTPQHTFTLPISTSECSVLQVTYSQGCKKLVKEYAHGVAPSGMVLDDDMIIINLSQEETKGFSVGAVSVQVRVLTNGGRAYASKEFNVNVKKVNSDNILE